MVRTAHERGVVFNAVLQLNLVPEVTHALQVFIFKNQRVALVLLRKELAIKSCRSVKPVKGVHLKEPLNKFKQTEDFFAQVRA